MLDIDHASSSIVSLITRDEDCLWENSLYTYASS